MTDKTTKLGYYAAIATTVLTIITFAIAVLTPPMAGPGCVAEHCYQYPYLDTAERFPRDFYWMYPAMLIMLAYQVLMVCIHRSAPEDKKVFSLAALIFGTLAAAILLVDYFLQVSVIQPSLLLNEADGVSMLSQFNPHGVFIALEDLGYTLMAIAFMFAAAVFTGDKKEKWLRRIFLADGILVITALIFYSAAYGIFREYRFEIASLSFNWLTLIIGGILLAGIFKKQSEK